MLSHLFSVSALTLLSRLTGFARDVVMGAVMGAGAMNDAFVTAFKLPNHFRTIFGEGAFNAAFTPHYARILETQGREGARFFSGRIGALLLLSLTAVILIAEIFTPFLVRFLAPGFIDDPQKFQLTVSLTRITFPYLGFIAVCVLHSGALNAHSRFFAAAFAPVLLNVSMVGALMLAFLFPNAGYAAAFGVTISGVLQYALLETAVRKAKIAPILTKPARDGDVKKFFNTFWPAVVGSAGPQIAVFADTIIGSMLPTGGPSSIYYADRLYQLPIGFIGVAAGTVLLPEMARKIAGGRSDEALRAQNRVMALTIALTTPFVVLFMTIPDILMQAAFSRGKFTVSDASAAAQVLCAYAIGLMAMVLISSARASFQARGDMMTPMKASLTGVVINIALKISLFSVLGAIGLAVATSVGAWVNFLILFIVAIYKDLLTPNAVVGKICLSSLGAGAALAVLGVWGPGPAATLAAKAPRFSQEILAAEMCLAAVIVYGAAFYFFSRAQKLSFGAIRR